MKLRLYLSVLIVGAVAAVAAIVLAVGLIRLSSSYRQVQASLDETDRALKQLASRRPFPNEENVALAATNRVKIESFFATVLDRFSKNQYEPPEIEPARFPQLLQRAIASMNRAALSNNVAIPPDRFMYGFDRYERGQPPRKQDIPRLARQLHGIETITRAICAAKIRELIAVERHVFEDEGPRAPGVDEGVTPPPQTPAAAGYKEDPHKLFVRERFLFEFRARESSIWEILDTLPRLPVFCVVSGIELENEAPRPVAVNPADGQRIVPGGEAGGTPPAELPVPARAGVQPRGPEVVEVVPATPSRPRPLKHEERTVAGLAETVKVRLAVDLYTFRRPEGEQTTKETTP